MKLTVIGSGTGVPDRRRGSPCCHLQTDGGSLIFDLGSGSVRQLWRRGIDIRKADVLALSHFHPDHTADVVPYFFALRNPRFGHGGRLALVGPAGTESYLAALEGVYGRWMKPEGLALSVHELPRGRLDFPDWTIATAPTGHTPESIAFRVEPSAGGVFVYGGDSPYSDDLVALSAGADLLLLECSFPEGRPEKGHLTPSEAGRVASGAGVRRLVLTHFYPETEGEDLLEPASRHFSGEVTAAFDGLEVEV